MDYREYAPHPSLRPLVRCLWTLESDTTAPPAAPEPIFPDGRVELVVHLADRFQQLDPSGVAVLQPAGFVAGQLRGPFLVRPTGRVATVGVRFRSAGAALFFRLPLDELTGRVVPLERLWGTEGRFLPEALAAAAPGPERVQLLQSALLRRLKSTPARDPLVEIAVARLHSVGNGLEVATVARELGVSRRHLVRRFRARVGLAPKEFARIARFQRVLACLRGGRPDWAQVALDCGYYDQPHLCRDFKHFSGLSPVAFLRAPQQLSQFFTGGSAPRLES